jgi:hypothetical protein
MSEQQISFGTAGGYYEIHVHGHLEHCWSDWLEGMEIDLQAGGEMILSGYLPDQAALMGVLNTISRLNLALLSVNRFREQKELEEK